MQFVFRRLLEILSLILGLVVGLSVVNIAATALVTEAATAIFGEAGVSAATGLMTVRIFFSTLIHTCKLLNPFGWFCTMHLLFLCRYYLLSIIAS